MKYGLYFGFMTFLRYAFGLLIFSQNINHFKINPFILLVVVIPVFSTMKSWSPYTKNSFHNQVPASSYNGAAIVHIAFGIAFALLLAANGVKGYGVIIIAHLLRSGVEEELGFSKYLERLSIDFVIIIIGFILSQTLDFVPVLEITCITISALTLLRYIKLRQMKLNVLNVKRIKVTNHVEN